MFFVPSPLENDNEISSSSSSSSASSNNDANAAPHHTKSSVKNAGPRLVASSTLPTASPPPAHVGDRKEEEEDSRMTDRNNERNISFDDVSIESDSRGDEDRSLRESDGGSGGSSGGDGGSDGGGGHLGPDMSPHFRHRFPSKHRIDYAVRPEIPYGAVAGRDPRRASSSIISGRPSRRTRGMSGEFEPTPTPILRTTTEEMVWADQDYWGMEKPTTTTTTPDTTADSTSGAHARVTRNVTPFPDGAEMDAHAPENLSDVEVTGSNPDYPADEPVSPSPPSSSYFSSSSSISRYPSLGSLSLMHGHPVFHQGDVVHIFPGIIPRQSLARFHAMSVARRNNNGATKRKSGRRRRRSLTLLNRRRKNSSAASAKKRWTSNQWPERQIHSDVVT